MRSHRAGWEMWEDIMDMFCIFRFYFLLFFILYLSGYLSLVILFSVSFFSLCHDCMENCFSVFCFYFTLL